MIIDPVILVNACVVAFSYMLSIQVMKRTIKLPLYWGDDWPQEQLSN